MRMEKANGPTRHHERRFILHSVGDKLVSYDKGSATDRKLYHQMKMRMSFSKIVYRSDSFRPKQCEKCGIVLGEWITMIPSSLKYKWRVYPICPICGKRSK